MEEKFRRRRLPHWDLPGGTYFITSCLAGSIPAEGLLRIREVEKELSARRSKNPSSDWHDRYWKLLFVERERWLDGQSAVRHLESPAVAEVVARAINHFHNIRYESIAYVVMPSHIHWLFRPLPYWSATVPPVKSPREVIMQSVLSFSAHECNTLLGRRGTFWQSESYDHCVRDDGELERILDYIEMNPVKAGLCLRPEEWRFSSAFRRVYT
jgi:putative transposase